MKRQKNLIILIGILVILCVGIFLVTGIEKHIDKISTVDEEVLAVSAEDLTNIAWKKDDTQLAFTQTDGDWTNDEDGTFPVDQNKMAELLEHFASLHAGFMIEDVEDYDQYGLKNPSATVTFTTEDGETVLELGDYSQMDSKRYATLGDGIVYLLEDDVEEALPADRDELMKADTLPEYDTVETLACTGENAAEVDYLPNEQHTYIEGIDYYEVSDGYKAISTDNINSLMSTLKNLDTTEYATYNASQENMADYGLDNANVTISVTTKKDDDETTTTIQAAQVGDDENTEKNSYYYRVNNSEIIYQLDAATYQTLAEAGYDTLRSTQLITLNWDKVQSLDITLDGETYTLTHEDDKWMLGDAEIDADDLISAVDGLTVNEFNTEAPGEKQEIAVTAHEESEDYPTLSFALYRKDGENCLAQFDGQTVGLISRSLLVTLTEAVNAIALG